MSLVTSQGIIPPLRLKMDNERHPIESIGLWYDAVNSIYSFTPPVRINFKYPCRYLVLDASSLKTIIRLWIQGEKAKLGGKYQDALHLQLLIKQAFKEEGINL